MDTRIEPLLEDLKNPSELVRQRATGALWQIWFEQKGFYGLEYLQRSQTYVEAGQYTQAEAVLSELIADQPDFAEAWNQRAVLYYSLGEYEKAIANCQQALVLNPVHFGALHGMGLCQAALEEYSAAIASFRQALEIQPYALINQKLILECTTRLS